VREKKRRFIDHQIVVRFIDNGEVGRRTRPRVAHEITRQYKSAIWQWSTTVRFAHPPRTVAHGWHSEGFGERAATPKDGAPNGFLVQRLHTICLQQRRTPPISIGGVWWSFLLRRSGKNRP